VMSNRTRISTVVEGKPTDIPSRGAELVRSSGAVFSWLRMKKETGAVCRPSRRRKTSQIPPIQSTSFAIKNPTTTEDTVATIPGSMKL